MKIYSFAAVAVMLGVHPTYVPGNRVGKIEANKLVGRLHSYDNKKTQVAKNESRKEEKDGNVREVKIEKGN